MADSYHTALSQITRVLKAAPVLPTVENVLRLASIYKLETYLERTDNSPSKLSIGGQIFVLDLDFEEIPGSAKDQTRFHMHSVSLILGNSEAASRDVSSATAETVFKNVLSLYPDLRKFDLCLERLAAIDQHSVLEGGIPKIDCFQFMSSVMQYLQGVFGHENVVINPRDEFAIEILGMFKIYLNSDEALSLPMYTFNGGLMVKRTNESGEQVVLNDVGFCVEILDDKSLPITKQMIKECDIEVSKDEKVKLPSVDDTFKTRRHGSTITVQILPMFQSDVVKTSKFKGGDIVKLVSAINSLVKLEELISVVDLLKQKCTLVDRFAEMETDAVRLSEFLASQDGSSADKMDVDQGNLTILISEEGLEAQGSVESLARTLSFNSNDFTVGMREFTSLLENEIL